MNKKIKQKPIIILTLSSIFILGCAGLYYYMWSNMQNTIDDIQQLVLQTGEQSSELSGVNIVVNTAKDTKESRDKLDNYFISDNEATILFIELIEKLAVDVGTEMDFTLDAIDNTVQFRLTVHGNYKNVYRYLVLLESLPYNIEIMRINLMEDLSNSEDGYTWSANLDLVFTGYYADSL